MEKIEDKVTEVKEEVVEEVVDEKNPDEVAEVKEEVAKKVYEDGSEELNKLLQSTSSKAKNEVLKALNVNSIEEIKTKLVDLEHIDSLRTELAETKGALEFERTERQVAQDKLMLNELQINPALHDVFLKLLNADTSGDDRATVALRTKELLKNGVEIDTQIGEIQIGAGASSVTESLDEQLNELMKK